MRNIFFFSHHYPKMLMVQLRHYFDYDFIPHKHCQPYRASAPLIVMNISLWDYTNSLASPLYCVNL